MVVTVNHARDYYLIAIVNYIYLLWYFNLGDIIVNFLDFAILNKKPAVFLNFQLIACYDFICLNDITFHKIPHFLDMRVSPLLFLLLFGSPFGKEPSQDRSQNGCDNNSTSYLCSSHAHHWFQGRICHGNGCRYSHGITSSGANGHSHRILRIRL